ncbi:PREDICTED: protein NDNF-like isoform X2 [Ceratosolen solmsi marchali]|uniref:Protein NDNF-like isoform X2 n=1 Tax=Ceratosolen solmsi marchali TaxID=326594 RepID=A0AAJ6VLJ3_9HYME|nr:PREDICTED: protein NDNF-like isoform X2 [Ceratosolen solmsi marchali]
MRLQLLVATSLLAARCRANAEESPLQRRMAGMNVHGSPRPFGAERPSRAEEFNLTGVLQPEYQIRATLKPNNVSQFYYLSPKTGPPPTLLVSPCSGPISWSISYVGPPETDQHAEGTKSQTHWPLKQMITGSPLFKYEGAETRNFTIPAAQANLYRIEMKPLSPPMLDLKTRSPNTVLLYATSDALGHLPGNLVVPLRGKRHQPLLEFQQRWSRRRLIVSWNKSHVNPDTSSYLLAVTSGAHLHPPTLCAAENILKKHPCPSRSSGAIQDQHRSEPEGLHCVRRTKLTLFGVKYNTTYYFTLYIMNTHNNVSSRVAMDSFRFQRKPPIILQSGRYATTNLRKSDGFAIFRYKPRENTSTVFNILACGACSVKAKFRGPGYYLEEQIGGEFLLRAPPLPVGRRFSIQITASQSDLVKMSKVKILATDDEPLNDNSATRSSPWEYRMPRKCRAKPASWCASSRGPRTPSGAASSTTGPCAGQEGRGPTHVSTRPCPGP